MRPKAEILTGAQILCRELVAAGVDVIFGYPGGAIMPFYHALPEYEGLRHILVRHEQAAAHAADGYARASGRVGVCVATSGPGATNLVTGLATAHMDSSPVLAITGQVGRPMIGRDAFQETDIIGLTLPITKYNHLVQDISELASQVREAVAIAQDGRPGPVLLDVPKDVQNQKAEYQPPPARAEARAATGAGAESMEQAVAAAARLIAEAARPLLMIGHGVILSGAYGEVRALAEKTGIPVITTLLGISAFPRAEIGKNVAVAVGIVGDARQVTARLVEAVRPRSCAQWLDEIRGFVRPRVESYSGDLSPEAILASIYEITGTSCTIVTDVGQHQMWVAKHYPYQRANTHITSGGLGTMGFAVPAAIGVHLARPGEVVWAISGDGGFQMNMAEIATMVQEGLSVKMAIFNNGYLGMVRQWQQFFHEKRYSCTPIWSPDYVKLADAYGIAGWRVENRGQLDDVVRRANAEPGPALVEFVIAQEANVYPMIPPGGSLSEPIEAQPAQPAETPAD